MPIDAGSYDPVVATVLQQVTVKSYGEPVQTQIEFCKAYIRFPYNARLAMERTMVRQTQSIGQITIRMRRNSKTKLITPDMQISHDGIMYGIISLQPIPSTERDEIEFLCQFAQPST